MANNHLHDELRQNSRRITISTRYGSITGGRASNGAAVYLEVPYALPPKRFDDPEPLAPDYRYENREYISETSYAAQPTNDGQAIRQGGSFEDKVGWGRSTENPLFVNIYCPSSFPSQRGFPVKVYIHGGYLQYGSPHSLNARAQYVAAERSEVWVNIGYRLSAFGFLASDKPLLSGNYGFKDQWLALEWVKANIESFGGDADNVQICGLSAGAHSVHQLLHHVSCLPRGQKAPFHSAVLQSNAIIDDPKTPKELRPQFHALCNALQLDPDSPDILEILRDPLKVPSSRIAKAIDDNVLEIQYQMFRGCLSGDWIITSPGPMARQRSGEFARGLKERGVRSIIVGEVAEEWYVYSLTQPASSLRDIMSSLLSLFSESSVQKLLRCLRKLPDDASIGEMKRWYGEALSAAQVHIPARLLHRDLCAAGFPTFRYRIEWVPQQLRSKGYITHGTDRALWCLHIPSLTADQVGIARDWLKVFYDADNALRTQKVVQNPNSTTTRVLMLRKDKAIQWAIDNTYDELLRRFENEKRVTAVL